LLNKGEYYERKTYTKKAFTEECAHSPYRDVDYRPSLLGCGTMGVRRAGVLLFILWVDYLIWCANSEEINEDVILKK